VGTAASDQAPADPAGLSLGDAPKRRGRGWRRGLVRQLLVVLFIGLWIGAVVYPDPRPFFTSVARLEAPPVDASAVAALAADLPSDYKSIEAFSLDYVVYRPAWTVYKLPWYFPSIAEVLRDRAGDCQARALLAASIFKAKGMPFTLRYSFDHVWVDYPGKQPPAMEDPATSFAADDGKGWWAKLPSKIPLWTIIKVRVGYHWTPMPLLQKVMIVLGTVLIVGWGQKPRLQRLWRRMRRPAPRKAVAEQSSL
jgi:hypothetical protein